MKRISHVPVDVQTAPAVDYCKRCGGEIYREETMYFWEGKWVCYDCFKTAVAALLDSNPQQIALEMQVDMQRYM